MKLTEKEKSHLLKYIGVKIKKDPLTNKYYWAQYLQSNDNLFASDGIEYNTREQAINAFLERAITPK